MKVGNLSVGAPLALVRASKYPARTRAEGESYTILNVSVQDLLSEVTADVKATVPLEIQTRYVLEQKPCLIVIGGTGLGQRVNEDTWACQESYGETTPETLGLEGY